LNTEVKVAHAKVDVKTSMDSYRAKPGEFRMLELPPLRYLTVDGHGDPNSPPYRDAIEKIYSVAYPLKFASKNAGRDYVVPPLEALWSASDMTAFTDRRDKSQWDWTILNLVPEWVADDAVAAMTVEGVRLETLDEGLCVQTLHLGPFDDEGPTLARLHHEFIPGEGLTMTGRHHEIYFSDVRRADPAKLRTILRQPVARLTHEENE
jgi:hypothetical protein